MPQIITERFQMHDADEETWFMCCEIIWLYKEYNYESVFFFKCTQFCFWFCNGYILDNTQFGLTSCIIDKKFVHLVLFKIVYIMCYFVKTYYLIIGMRLSHFLIQVEEIRLKLRRMIECIFDNIK